MVPPQLLEDNEERRPRFELCGLSPGTATKLVTLVWLGIEQVRNRIRWVTGEPLVYHRFQSWRQAEQTAPKTLNKRGGHYSSWEVSAVSSLADIVLEWED